MNIKDKTVFKYVGITLIYLVFALFYLYFVYHLALSTNIDADYGNLVLEAADIVNGNAFLSGWNQTGVSFLLTDILYFIVGVVFFGASKTAYILAVMLMFLLTMATTLFLTDYKKIKNNILFMALTAFPTIETFELLRAHTGGYVWTFLLFIMLSICLKKNKIYKSLAAVMVVLIAMTAMSDAAALLFGVFSISIICIYKLIFDKESSKKLYGILLGIMMSGTILGILFDKVYYLIGGANKNSFLGSKAFISIDALIDKLYVYFDSVFTLSNADVFGKSLFKFGTIVNCLYIPIVCIGFYLTFKNIKSFLKNKNDDIISVAISIGFVLVSVVFIFTTIAVDIYSSRYFATLPFFFAVLICRYIMYNNLMEQKIFTSRIKLQYLVLAFSAIVLVGGYINISKNIKYEAITEQEGLVGFLLDNNLKNGYGNYWDSSVVSIRSEGDVTIRQIRTDGVTASPLIWFSKDDWYEEEANFVAMHNPEMDDFGTTEGSIKNAFGEPSKILTFGPYIVYVYNYDISKKLIK